jgi:hypothetical protein
VQQEELDIELDGTHTRAVMTGEYISHTTPHITSVLYAKRTRTATLVEGSDYISYTLNHQSGSENLHLGVHCNVSGDNLICGDTKPLTLTSVGYLTLDVGTGAPKETGAPGTNGAIGAGQKTAASVLNVAVALILAAAANQLF